MAHVQLWLYEARKRLIRREILAEDKICEEYYNSLLEQEGARGGAVG
jgi:hypothetical protein